MKIYTGSPNVVIEATKGEVALLTLGLRTWVQMASVISGGSNDQQHGMAMVKELEVYLQTTRSKDETRPVDSDNLRDARTNREGVSAKDGGAVRRREHSDSTRKEDGHRRPDGGTSSSVPGRNGSSDD